MNSHNSQTNKKVKAPQHGVIFLSQHSKSIPQNWRHRTYGLTALKMILNYWQGLNSKLKSPPIKQLLKTGLELKAYIPGIGWSHKGLIEIAKKFGYDGVSYNLAKIPLKKACQTMAKNLRRYPMMASVWKNFDPKTKSGHLIVVTGISGEKVYLNDPEEKNEALGKKTITLKKFLQGWKKRYIGIYPK